MIQHVYISVTQEDINNGERGDSCKCPIALALKRACPLVSAEVCKSYMYFEDGVTRWFTSAVPVEAVNFIQEFDTYGAVLPFDFVATFYQKES